MRQINSKQVIETPPILIDPNDSPPKGLQGWEYSTGTDGEGRPDITDVTEYSTDDIDDVDTSGVADTAEDGKLTAPTNLTIVSQTVSYDANGNHRINVVISFDSVPGAVKYESKVSK